MGIVSAAVTVLSCLAAMWLTVSVVFEQVRRSCVCCYLPMAYAPLSFTVSACACPLLSMHTLPVSGREDSASRTLVVLCAVRADASPARRVTRP